MFVSPLWFVWGYIFLRWLFVRAPRGLYHLLVPRAYDRWKVRHEFKTAWAEHRRNCEGCKVKGRELHRAVVLADVEDGLLATGEIRHGIPRDPDEITVAPGRAIMSRASQR